MKKGISPSSPLSLSHLSKGQRIDYGEITVVFMAVQTHNDTVMTGNLTTLAEENAEKEVTAVHFYLCVVVCDNRYTCRRAILGGGGGGGTTQPTSEGDCC